MQKMTPPVFGKRNAPRRASEAPQRTTGRLREGRDTTAEAPRPAHADFFAAVRAEMELDEPRRFVVPWSYKAASLTGIVIGCALAGFDVTGQTGTDHLQAVAGLLGVHVDASRLLPALIAMGLLAGSRVAIVTMLSVHLVLAGVGRTSHLAYALGGAVGSIAFGVLTLAVAGHPPEHGWLVEWMAGMGAGLCYRAFAGARAAGTPVASA